MKALVSTLYAIMLSNSHRLHGRYPYSWYNVISTQEHGVLYVYTLANAGKVKRIRRHSRIRLTPCTMRGTVIGPWVEAEATIMDATTAAHGHALLRHKYGWLKGIGDLFSHFLHRERVVIAIRVLT